MPGQVITMGQNVLFTFKVSSNLLKRLLIQLILEVFDGIMFDRNIIAVDAV